MTKKFVVVVGGGITGIETAINLSKLGFFVWIFEKQMALGGNIRNYYKLFPHFTDASELISDFKTELIKQNIEIYNHCEVKSILKKREKFEIITNTITLSHIDAIVLCTGYDTFNASKKEEYGYGIYKNVITSVELEKLIKSKSSFFNNCINVTNRIAFVNCVGSRDNRVRNRYCSKVCCITAVKQAIELKKINSDLEIYCFYMDLRMFDLHFEELYKEAQEKWAINFIRGKVSEAAESINGSISVKAEDTLAGRPIKMSVDKLVLMVGIVPSEGIIELSGKLGVNTDENGFVCVKDNYFAPNSTNIEGVFVAGTAVSPKTLDHSILDARSAAIAVHNYCKRYI